MLEEIGLVWFARREDGWEADGERVLRAAGVPVERLEPGEACRMFPSLAVDDLAFVLHEPEGGVLRAAEGVRALVARAREAGAQLLAGEAHPDGAAVRFGSDRLEADAVVWACGAWLGHLFSDLVRLRVTFQQLTLFDVPPEWRVPGWVDFDAAFYGHGLVEPYGMKVGGRPGRRRDGPGRAAARGHAGGGRAVRASTWPTAFPRSADAPVCGTPACHYGLTADGQFLFDRHPEHPGVWLLGGGSGHGYKHGPALAEHVAAVLAGREQPEPRFALGERTRSRSLRTAGAG